MKAVSLHQPWASLVATGAKSMETRSWPPQYSGPLALHASKWRPGARRMLDPVTEDACALMASLLWPLFPAEPVGRMTLAQRLELFDALPRGAVLATCRLVDALEVRAPSPGSADLVDRRGRVVRQVPDRELQFGCYATGRWAWILAGVEALHAPEPVRGFQGLWDWYPRTPPRGMAGITSDQVPAAGDQVGIT